MDMRRKIEVAERAVESIARHDDEDLAVRRAALQRLRAIVDREEEAAARRVAERVAQQLG